MHDDTPSGEESNSKPVLSPLQKPATLEDAIEHMVAVRLEAEKKLLEEEYTSKEVRFFNHRAAAVGVGSCRTHET